MDDLIALHRAILESPYDDTVRLAYADELDAVGQHARAKYIRWAVAVPTWNTSYEPGQMAYTMANPNETILVQGITFNKTHYYGDIKLMLVEHAPPTPGIAWQTHRGMVMGVMFTDVKIITDQRISDLFTRYPITMTTIPNIRASRLVDRCAFQPTNIDPHGVTPELLEHVRTVSDPTRAGAIRKLSSALVRAGRELAKLPPIGDQQ